VFVQQIFAVVKHAGIDVPGHGVETAVETIGLDRTGNHFGKIGLREIGREIQ
jgi:hypothetical protein